MGRVAIRLANLGCALGLLAACASEGPTPVAIPPGDSSREWLLPTGIITGGLGGTTPLAPPALPLRRPPGVAALPAPAFPAPPPAYVKLMFPTAMAATPQDLFVADSGQAALLRVDLVSHTVQRLGPLPALTGVRLVAGPDGSLYVLRPDRRDIVHLRRDGSSLGTLTADPLAAVPADLVVEPTQRRLWLADRSGGLSELQPLGGLLEPLGVRGRAPSRLRLLAAGRLAVYGVEEDCQCLVRLDREGRVAARGAPGSLPVVDALAVDPWERVWVVDGTDGQLKLFVDLAPVTALSPRSLGLGRLTALAIDPPRLFLADGPGGRIASFSLVAPRPLRP